jgi:hypothetical protein
MAKVFTECDRCSKPIYVGNPYVVITRNIEYAEFNISTNSEEIEVVDSVSLITFCGSCGNSFDEDMIKNIINTIPTNIRSNGNN